MKRADTQPKFLRSPLSYLTFGLLGCGILLSAHPVVAQTAPLPSGGSDVNSSGDMPDMFNLMHQLQRGEIRNPYQFQQDQQQNIRNEAVDFREQQRRALEQQSQTGTPQGTVEALPSQPSQPNEL